VSVLTEISFKFHQLGQKVTWRLKERIAAGDDDNGKKKTHDERGNQSRHHPS